MEENYNFDGFQKLANENEKLKEFTYAAHTNIMEIFSFRKDFLLKSYATNSQSSQNEQTIHNLKKYQLLNLEEPNFRISSICKLEELLEVMHENMKRLKQFFLIFNENCNGNQIFNDVEFEVQLNKIKETNELKNNISKIKN